MKKIRVIAVFCIMCVFLSACSGRKASSQLKDVEVLHARGTQILDASDSALTLRADTLVLSAEQSLTAKDIQAALQQSEYNSICLQLDGSVIDDSVAPWVLNDTAQSALNETMTQCRSAEKYLLLDIINYPQDYSAWYKESSFGENVAALWAAIAEQVKDEGYFGAYVLNHFPRSGTSENTTSLGKYEQLLQMLCERIRTVDATHMIAVGMLDPYVEDEDEYHGFPYVKDANFMYVAVQRPLDVYTEQTQTTMDGAAHLVYPGTFWHNINGLDTRDVIKGSQINLSSTEYQTRATAVFEAEEEELFARIGAYVMPPDLNGGGELRILSMRFVECDENGSELREIYNMDSSVGTPFSFLEDAGSYGGASVYDDGTAYLESILESVFFFAEGLNIPLEKGKFYQLTVTMKQRGMTKDFVCVPALQLYTTHKYDLLDAALIDRSCKELFAEAEAVGVPLMIVNVGVGENVTEEKGRTLFLSDLSAALDSYGLSSVWR